MSEGGNCSPGGRSDPSDPFFFIVGFGRSGTTLLQSLLSDHSRLIVPPETHYIKRAVAWGADEREAPRDFEAFFADLTSWSRFADLGIAAQDVRNRLVDQDTDSFRDLFSAMLHTYGAAHGAARVGEKTPSHYQHVERLLRWYPDARILFMRRDPRAVVASHLRAPWVTSQMTPPSLLSSFTRRSRLVHVVERAALWRRVYGHFLPAALADPRVKLLSYEDLVTEPEAMVREVCDFLGETYEPEMLAERSAAAVPDPASRSDDFQAWRKAHRGAARAQVSADSLDKWKQQLSPFETAMIEAICEEPMSRGAYKMISTPRERHSARRLAGTLLFGLDLEDRLRGTEKPM